MPDMSTIRVKGKDGYWYHYWPNTSIEYLPNGAYIHPAYVVPEQQMWAVAVDDRQAIRQAQEGGA